MALPASGRSEGDMHLPPRPKKKPSEPPPPLRLVASTATMRGQPLVPDRSMVRAKEGHLVGEANQLELVSRSGSGPLCLYSASVTRVKGADLG